MQSSILNIPENIRASVNEIEYTINSKKTLDHSIIIEFTYPNGETSSGRYYARDGFTQGFTYSNGIWDNPSAAPSGIFTVRILDYTGKEHAQATIYIGD